MTGIEKNVSFGFLVKFPFRNKHETSTRCDCIIPIYVHFRRVTVIFGNLSEAQDRVKRFSLPLQKLASDGLIFLMAQMQLKIFEYYPGNRLEKLSGNRQERWDAAELCRGLPEIAKIPWRFAVNRENSLGRARSRLPPPPNTKGSIRGLLCL